MRDAKPVAWMIRRTMQRQKSFYKRGGFWTEDPNVGLLYSDRAKASKRCAELNKLGAEMHIVFDVVSATEPWEERLVRI